MSLPTEVQVAEVWRDDARVGTITRTAHGSDFEYSQEFFQQHAGQKGGIAVHLPYSRRRTGTHGTNLHPFFAGLLPEGLRLRVLVSRTKTSEDDLLSLLIAAGTDTVGDLAVVPQGDQPRELALDTGRWKPEAVLFPELLAQSLARTRSGEDEPLIPGVQEKVSASTVSFPLRPPGRRAYLLKLNPEDKPELVQNEDFFMRMAKGCGLRVATTRLLRDREGNPGLLVERFDRRWLKQDQRLVRIHQEDGCQFLNRYPSEKYRLSCAELARGIQHTCAAPIPELARFLVLVAFSYLVGNGDLHAKNVSILADGPAGGFRLSPAYDLLTTLPYGDRRMAMKLEGRDDNLTRAHLIAFGARHGVNARAVGKLLDRLSTAARPWIARLEEIGFDRRRTKFLRETIRKRLQDLSPS
ncbi:MAG: HipA domain-containing protein [Myxococcota bacterium]|nr:HipA domain-containing protein [Myxococcota bacterium]